MTREEAKKLVRIVVSSYPNYKPTNLTDTVDVWALMLEEFSYQQVAAALKAYILSDTSGFAPSIGQLIDKVQTIHDTNPQLNEMQAWALVSKALKNGTYGAQEEFDKLPPTVQKAVGSPSQLRNWAVTDEDSIENVIQSNFLRTYRVICQREKEISKMPTDIKAIMQQNSSEKLLYAREQEIKQLDVRNYKGVPMPDNVKKELEKMKRGE